MALPFDIFACFTREINLKKATYMLNCDGKSPKKLVKHADITKFRQQNILESFLRPGTKVTLIFFQFVHVFQRRNNGSVGKTVVPLGRICPLQNFTFGIR